MKEYKIVPLALSDVLKIPAASFYYKQYTGDPVELVYGCLAVVDPETNDIIMIDTGLAKQADIEKYGWPFRRMPGAPNLDDVMAAKGLDPLNVKKIIFTHLHQDHCFNLELFPNAKELYVQKEELMHAVTPMPIEAKSYQKYDLPGLPSWAPYWGRMIAKKGDYHVQDGIDVIFTPGHTPGSQSVIVHTAEGDYVCVGDNYYSVEQYEKVRMNGNFTNLEGWYDSHERVRAYLETHKAAIMMTHSPLTYEREIWG